MTGPREKLLAKLDALMGDHRYTRKALAEAIGVSPATVNNWFVEGSNRSPTTAQWLRIARIFAVTMDSLCDPDQPALPLGLPEDEAAVLAHFRFLKRTAALTRDEATDRLSRPRPFVGSPANHPDDDSVRSSR